MSSRESPADAAAILANAAERARRMGLRYAGAVTPAEAKELAARAGYEGAYNILEGFEGDNGAGKNGWRATGLPWKQGKD